MTDLEFKEAMRNAYFTGVNFAMDTGTRTGRGKAFESWFELHYGANEASEIERPSDGEIYAAVSRKMADRRADLEQPAAQPFGVPTVVDDDEGKPARVVLGYARTGPITESLSDTDEDARRKIEGEE